MDISLLHAGLAAGAALAALPVILHLFMKQKPKHIIFPALRLIRERQKKSKKKLKVKNWLLLAARMLLLALMALALARPTLNSETSLGDQEVPTALALVFDTSMSMEYTERGNNRLAEAKLRALEILKKTTEDSEVYVIDSANPVKPDPVAPSSARKRIDALALRAANSPLNKALVQANAAVSASTLARREVYVLTDLASSAWDLGSSGTTEELARIRKDKKTVKTYLLRLTPKEVRDVAVVAAEPASTVAAEGEPMEVRVTLRSSGPATTRVAEFYLDGDRNKRDQKSVDLPANGEKELTFLTPARLEVGLHQGKVKLAGGDPMAFDDVRYFSFNVQPAQKILIVADRATDQDLDAFFVRNALSPTASISASDPTPLPSPYRVDTDSRKQFQDRAKLSSKDYTCVFLLNVDRLTTTDWTKLLSYVREGGGLVVAPGDRSEAAGYAGAVPSALLPATLETKKQAAAGTTFGRAEYDHPLFSRHPKLLDPELIAWPVYRYWTVKPLEGSRTILKFSDGAPALIDRAIKGSKTGHVMLWTTPLSRRVDREDQAAWNELPLSWAFVDILLQTIPYLAGTAGERLNYEAGENAVVMIDPNRRASSYSVDGPEANLSERLSAPVASDLLLVSSPSKEGQWTVKGTGPDGSKMKMGFSVNVPVSESKVVALKPNDLDGLLGGKENYKIADSSEQLREAIGTSRFGFELFPWIMFLILALVTAENLLANKFHRETATT